MTISIRTRTIAGHKIALTAGREYLASRPMARRGMARFDVKITDITDGFAIDARPAAVIPNLSYDDANQFLRRFNRNPHKGRTW